MKRIVIGILAHVDAGKTTLSEGLLQNGGMISKMGRVDHKDTVLDMYNEERARGITIFSKQAQINLENTVITLLDTPGHVDFSAEMERTLSVLDYAILVISGADGIQGHTRTLWGLLKKYNIPVFIFVNKMDQPQVDKEFIFKQLVDKLSKNVVDFSKEVIGTDIFNENVAVCDENMLEHFLETGEVEEAGIIDAIHNKKLFPVFYGSALKNYGVKELLEEIDRYTRQTVNSEDFGALVYKVSRDNQGNRLTYVKITSGALAVKNLIKERLVDGSILEEKVNQIRLYQGAKYDALNEAVAGMVVALTGLSKTYALEGLGIEKDSPVSLMVPVISYELILPENVNARQFFAKLKDFEEEEPSYNITWNERFETIQIKLMGEVQTEVLKSRIEEKLGVNIEFSKGQIIYRETIKNTVEGVGHYEPLRHYAEVHLKMEPLPAGSGIVCDSKVSEDLLDRNWQRLIMTHIEEKEHVGVLTGSNITDMKITVVAGRAHLKHTEGGDFRQATYRAIRHGLMKAESVLLEPYYDFELVIPADCVGRAMTDLEKMKASFAAPVIEGENATITGNAPVDLMQGYSLSVTAYTKGHGSLSCRMAGYMECHNPQEVIERFKYDPLLDNDNPCGSVFCTHGAGFVVPYEEVENYMHLPLTQLAPVKKVTTSEYVVNAGSTRYNDNLSFGEDKELMEIFKRTYGEGKDRKSSSKVNRSFDAPKPSKILQPKPKEDEYLLVDGYNVIHAIDDLHELALINLESARDALIDILCNYQGFKNYIVILVFDAYKVKGNPGTIYRHNNIDVVYTKEAETADRYIEKTAHEMGKKYNVTVVTSDGVEQVIIMGAGCKLMSSREFEEDVKRVDIHILEALNKYRKSSRNYLFDNLDEETYEKLENIRLGKSDSDE